MYIKLNFYIYDKSVNPYPSKIMCKVDLEIQSHSLLNMKDKEGALPLNSLANIL